MRSNMPELVSLFFCIQRLHKRFAWNHVVARTWRACIVFPSCANLPLFSSKPRSWCSFLPEQLIWIIRLGSGTFWSLCKWALQSGATDGGSRLLLQSSLWIIDVITWPRNLFGPRLILLLDVISGSIQAGLVYIIGAYAWYAGTLFAFVFYLETSTSVANCGLWGVL